MPRLDRHNEVELNLLSGGSLTYLIWGQRVTVHGGRLAAFWAAIPHQIIDFGEVESYFVVTIPLAWVLDWNLPGGLVRRLLHGEVVQEKEDVRAPSDAALMSQWCDDLKRKSDDPREIMLLELKARLARLAFGSEGEARHAGSDSSPAGAPECVPKAEQMARFVAENYRLPISIADIAESVELHPDYAATLFKKTFGTTLNRFLVDHRIQHSQRMLVTSDETILTISLESGFNSLSRFNVAFKDFCGLTPSRFRKLHRL